MYVLSCFSPVGLFATLWTVAHQAPLSMGFSRQGYWSGLLCPLPGGCPDPLIKLESMYPLLADRFFNPTDSLPLASPGKPHPPYSESGETW